MSRKKVVTGEIRQCKECGVDYPLGKFRRWSCDPCQSIKTKASKYKISFEEAKTMTEQTHCDLCKEEIIVKSCIDHDHVTGKVRGVLCPNCNNGLGMFKDSQVLLYTAADYLKRNQL